MQDKQPFNLGNLSIQDHRSPLPLKNPAIPPVLAQRGTPGIVIFNLRSEMVYINAEGREILTSIPHGQNGGFMGRSSSSFMIPDVVLDLMNSLRISLKLNGQNPNGVREDLSHTPSAMAISTVAAETFLFRALFLGNQPSREDDNGYIFILIERVSAKKKINIKKARQQYNLSKRETEVVELLLFGYRNKEIAEKLSVCVYTIEDHLKKIMKKMQARNRTGIIANLLET